jgi:hypothetical protein
MPDKKKKYDVSWFNNGVLGFHLTINPQPPLPPSASIYRQFFEHGILVRDKELDSILSGRDEAVRTMNTILTNIKPNLGPELNLKLANTLADALLSKSLQGQLSREAPTALDRFEQQDAVLEKLIPSSASGSLPHLFNSLPPVGFSLTVHF